MRKCYLLRCLPAPGISFVPSHWVPTEVVVDMLPSTIKPQVLANVTAYFTKVLHCELARHEDFRGERFITVVRRPTKQDTNVLVDSTNTLEEFILRPPDIARLALCTPSNYIPVDAKLRHFLMQSVPWLLKSKWPLRSIFGFYPSLFDVAREPDFVRVRSKVSDFETTQPHCSPADWTCFVERLLPLVEGNTLEYLEASLCEKDRELLEKLFPENGMTGFLHAHSYYVRKLRSGMLHVQIPKKAGPILGIYLPKNFVTSLNHEARIPSLIPLAEEISGLHPHGVKSSFQRRSEKVKKLKEHVKPLAATEHEDVAKRLYEMFPDDASYSMDQLYGFVQKEDLDRIKITTGLLRFFRKHPKYFEVHQNGQVYGIKRKQLVVASSSNDAAASRVNPSAAKDDTRVSPVEEIKVILTKKACNPTNSSRVCSLTALGNQLTIRAKQLMCRQQGTLRKYLLAHSNHFQLIRINDVDYVQEKPRT